MPIVFYLNPGATDDICDVVREALPAGWTLATPQGDDFTPQLGVCDFILVADHPITAQHIAAAPRLKMIQHQGVGYERIDLDACGARGIPVALTPEGTSVGVAEHTLLLILALYKRLLTAAGGVRRGEWHQWDLRASSFELCGKTVGLVGYGRIGREVARRLLAFDARVRTFDPLLGTGAAFDPAVERASSLPDLLASADIVSLHLPMRAETRHLIGPGTLGQMKPGAVLVNTSRGGVVDEAALVEALSNGRLAGAALDVLEEEPPPAGHPLLAFDQVLVTPHIAAGTVDALRAKMRAAFANLSRFAAGEPLRHVVPELAALATPHAHP